MNSHANPSSAMKIFLLRLDLSLTYTHNEQPLSHVKLSVSFSILNTVSLYCHACTFGMLDWTVELKLVDPFMMAHLRVKKDEFRKS